MAQHLVALTLLERVARAAAVLVEVGLALFGIERDEVNMQVQEAFTSFLCWITPLQHSITYLIDLCLSVQQMHPAKRECQTAVLIFHLDAQRNSRRNVTVMVVYPYDIGNAVKPEHSTVFDKQILSANPELVVRKGLCRGKVAVHTPSAAR